VERELAEGAPRQDHVVDRAREARRPRAGRQAAPAVGLFGGDIAAYAVSCKPLNPSALGDMTTARRRVEQLMCGRQAERGPVRVSRPGLAAECDLPSP
jgi:hypothetical protein